VFYKTLLVYEEAMQSLGWPFVAKLKLQSSLPGCRAFVFPPQKIFCEQLPFFAVEQQQHSIFVVNWWRRKQ